MAQGLHPIITFLNCSIPKAFGSKTGMESLLEYKKKPRANRPGLLKSYLS
jgi:hypothetical protein